MDRGDGALLSGAGGRTAGIVLVVLAAVAGPAAAACPGSAVVFFDGFETGDVVAWTTSSMVGLSRDFWTGAALAGTTITLASPARTDTSRSDGRYRLLDLAAAADLAPVAMRPSGYRLTTNGPIAWSAVSKSCDLYSMATADVSRQYVLAGVSETPGTAFLAGYLQGPDGAPLEGIPAADLALVDGGQNPVGVGPYFFGAGGDIDLGITVSTAFGGAVRFAFLNVPAGTATVSLASVVPEEEDVELLTVAAGSGHLVVLGGVD